MVALLVQWLLYATALLVVSNFLPGFQCRAWSRHWWRRW